MPGSFLSVKSRTRCLRGHEGFPKGRAGGRHVSSQRNGPSILTAWFAIILQSEIPTGPRDGAGSGRDPTKRHTCPVQSRCRGRAGGGRPCCPLGWMSTFSCWGLLGQQHLLMPLRAPCITGDGGGVRPGASRAANSPKAVRVPGQVTLGRKVTSVLQPRK